MTISTNFRRFKELCPNLPWCQDDPELLGRTVINFVYDQESYIRKWAQRWFENFQFIFGNTTIKWSRKYDFAVDTDFLRRNTALNQRASTQLARTIVEALGSLIYANLPGWSVESASESSQQGRRYAKIVEKLLDAYMDRLSMDKEFAVAAMIFVSMGQCAAFIDWDDSSGQVIKNPQWRKVKAPVFTDYMASNMMTGGLLEVPTPALDSMGAPYFEDRWEPVIGPDGNQLVNSIKAGDVSLGMLTPFEYRREIGTYGMHKTRYIERIRLIDYDSFISEYENVGERTKSFKSVQPFMNDSLMYAFAIRHFMRMQFTTPPTLSEGLGFARSQSVLKGTLFKNKVLVIEHWDKPNAEMWPNGRRIVVANGLCTNIAEPKFKLDRPGGWHPFAEAQWLTIAPSSIACGPMDAVTSKNRELNVADSLIATALRRNLGSQLLIKIGSGLDPDKISGEPGQAHMVNDVTGARWLHDEMQIPPALKMLRDSYKEDCYETSGAQDSLRGDRSKGVSAGYAMRQLQEREERRLTPARKAFEFFAAEIGEKMIACLKQNCVKLDENVIGFLKRKSAGEFQTNDIISFLSSPMEYGVDIKVSPTSMIMKSKASLQADYLELAKGPAAQRIANDAGVLDEFLKFFDAEKLRDKSASHRDRAKRENEILSDLLKMGPNSMGIRPPIVLFEDDDNIHIQEHTDWLIQNSEEILANEAMLQQILMHMETHRIQMQEKQAQALPGTALSVPMMTAQARTMPPPGAPQIYQDAFMRSQAQAQQKPPPAPKEPGNVGEGAKTQPSAPSQNTQPSTTQGGIPQ